MSTGRTKAERRHTEIDWGARKRLRRRRRLKVTIPTIATLDLRTRAGRMFVATRDEIIADRGGRQALSRAELELVDRAAGLSTRLAAADADMLDGREPSLSPTDYSALSNALVRILGALGLKRQPRDVTPSLDAYIASKGNGGAT